jgi:hypothetical protein
MNVERTDCDYNKRNVSVVIFDTDIHFYNAVLDTFNAYTSFVYLQYLQQNH